MHADDFDYSFSFMTKERNRTIVDVFYSQITHYQILNGRISTLGFAQLLLLLDQKTIDVILSFLFVLLGVLVLYHIEGRVRNISWVKLMYVYIMLFMFTPAVGQSYLWTNSAAIYLGGVVMILLYLIPYRKVMADYTDGLEQKRGVIYNAAMFIIMLLLGFMAGDAGEAMSAGVLFTVLGFLVYFRLKKIKIQPWMLGMGNILGLVALIASPGNQKRVSGVGGIRLFLIPKRFALVSALFFEKMQFFIVLGTLIIILAYVINRKANTKVLEYLKSLPGCGYIYFLGALASVYSMILLPFFPSKAWSFCVAFLIIVLFTLGKEFENYIFSDKYKKVVAITTAVIVVTFGGIYMNAFFTVKSANFENDKRLVLINQAVENGEDTVTIPAILDYNKYTPYEGSGELSWDPSLWPNTSMARYYGFKEVIRDDNPLHYQ
jgi:hypothetical protein